MRDGNVTVDEAQTYVQRSLKSTQITNQTPEVIGARDLVLSVRAREAAPVIVAARVEQPRAEVPRSGEAVVVAGTDFQQKLEAAKRDAAAAAEREFIAAEAAKARAARLGVAEAALRRQATADWASAKSLVDGGGAGAKAAAEAFIAAYGAAKVRVDGEERGVAIGELEVARGAMKSAVVTTTASSGIAAGIAGVDFESPTLGLMKWIPAGTFLMGSPGAEAGREDDETQHRVTLTKGYWMMENEVTQGEWLTVMGSTPSRFSECGPTCPVEQVSWDDAVAFATAASKRDGVPYRLPTEAEWERAARGGRSGERYAGGIELDRVGWFNENSHSRSHPAGQRECNGYGLCDMSGNVWEWAFDWYSDAPLGAATDPLGPAEGQGRVMRGGSWGGDAPKARVAERGAAPVGYRRAGLIGFRLIRPAP